MLIYCYFNKEIYIVIKLSFSIFTLYTIQCKEENIHLSFLSIFHMNKISYTII